MKTNNSSIDFITLYGIPIVLLNQTSHQYDMDIIFSSKQHHIDFEMKYPKIYLPNKSN